MQETQQVAARDEKWVPFTKRVKISSTNVRLKTTVPQKEETFQVVIDLIKNSKCFKAFTISADVPEIFMQQFWYSIKKVQGTDSYEFLLANKKYVVNADVFRTILDIYPRVEGVNFTDVPYDDTTLSFLNKLGYKGPLYKHTNMFVDHMHQPWRTLAAIINKCLSRKTASNDKLRRRRDQDVKICHFPDSPRNMDFPFLRLCDKQSNKQNPIRFLKYSTGQIPFKKSKGKGSQRKKIVDVSEESEPEPEPVKRKTSSKRRIKKKVTLSANDNIISDDADTALELGKSISKTEAEEAEATRQVLVTHARIVTEFVPEPTKRRKSGKVTSDPPKKLKGVPSLTPEEQEAIDIMQALKESKKTSKRQPGTRGLNEGTGTILGVPNESTVVSATLSEGTGTKPAVPDEEKEVTKENVILEWGSEQESEYSEEDKLDDEEKDDKEVDVDDEDDETESDEDDIYKYKIRVHKDEDEEMLNAEVDDSDKGDEEVTDAAKADAEKTSEVKDDAKKTKIPPTSSSLSVSSGFGDQFLKLSSDSSFVSTVKDTTDAEINLLLEVQIQSEVPHIQSPSMLTVPVLVISEPSVLTPVQESPSKATITTLPPPSISTTPFVPQQTTTSIPTPTITTDAPTITTAVLESEALFAVQLRVAKLEKRFDLEQESEKTPSNILKIKKEQAEKQKMPKFTIKPTDKATLKEYDQKSALYQTMHANKSFNRNPANHRLYHAIMEALIEDENAMDKGVADTVQDHKRKHDDDDKDPPAGPNQGKKAKRRRTKESESSKKSSTTKETPKGKASSKGSKTGKSALAKEPVEEPIVEVVIDDAGDDEVHDDDQPQDASEPKISKTPNPEWFTQPLSPPTPDPKWNKRQVVLDQPEQPWFNQMVSATKDPLTFDDLMATPINFSKLDWNNPQGYHYPFDLSKPLPLQGHPGHLTIAANYFFNNDLEYLKYSDPKRTRDMVKRADRQFYKFKEGDFVDLHLNDIEDMLLLAVQRKLFHLINNDIVDYTVALRMFTRSLVIKKRVKALQLGVESYQKKLNITLPQQTFTIT
ncbi:hypothetical protein Tco_1004853 [Tanacetum coccineum]|uniref:Uncharacterized protein n=1 Tax=Tanacetum coccineum TaxID=301880 RepID=A0ABQ5FEE9_9ASTR